MQLNGQDEKHIFINWHWIYVSNCKKKNWKRGFSFCLYRLAKCHV